MDVIDHYDLLIEEQNDPFRDLPVLQEYMSKWDGEPFLENPFSLLSATQILRADRLFSASPRYLSSSRQIGIGLIHICSG